MGLLGISVRMARLDPQFASSPPSPKSDLRPLPRPMPRVPPLGHKAWDGLSAWCDGSGDSMSLSIYLSGVNIRADLFNIVLAVVYISVLLVLL